MTLGVVVWHLSHAISASTDEISSKDIWKKHIIFHKILYEFGSFLFDNTTTYSALNHSSSSFPTPVDSTDEGDVSIVTVDDGAIRGRLDL